VAVLRNLNLSAMGLCFQIGDQYPLGNVPLVGPCPRSFKPGSDRYPFWAHGSRFEHIAHGLAYTRFVDNQRCIDVVLCEAFEPAFHMRDNVWIGRAEWNAFEVRHLEFRFGLLEVVILKLCPTVFDGDALKVDE